MLKMDLSEMDRLKNQLYRSSANAEEVLYIINRLQSETTCDDLLKSFSQYETVADDFLIAEKTIVHIKETLYDLGKIVSEASALCHESESQKANLICGSN